MVRGVRGAITVKQNETNEIITATEFLLLEMIKENNINPQDVAQVIISVTEDINATFPAAALRRIDGWSYVPVMCVREIPVPDSLTKCIRVMMTVNTMISQEDIFHVYLEDAVKLRPDLVKKK